MWNQTRTLLVGVFISRVAAWKLLRFGCHLLSIFPYIVWYKYHLSLNNICLVSGKVFTSITFWSRSPFRIALYRYECSSKIHPTDLSLYFVTFICLNWKARNSDVARRSRWDFLRAPHTPYFLVIPFINRSTIDTLRTIWFDLFTLIIRAGRATRNSSVWPHYF